MMEISCESCGKKYKIDGAKLVKPVTRLKCKQCGDIISVVKPEEDVTVPEPPVEEPAYQAPVPEPEVEAKASEPSEKKGGKSEKEGKPGGIRFGLVSKVILVMLIVSLIPFGLFLGLTFNQTRARLQEDSQALMAQTADGLGGQVDEWVDKNVRVLQAAAGMPAIQTMDQGVQTPVLEAIQKAYPYMYLVYTLDANGRNIARNDGNSLRDYADRQYYKDIANGKQLSWQTLISKTNNKPALVLSVPIMKEGRLIGVMAGAMSIADVSKSVARWRKGQTGFAFLTDEQGKVVAHQSPQFVVTQKNLKAHPLVAAYLNRRQPQAVTFTENEELIQGYVRGNKFGWVLAIQQSDAEVFAAHKKAERFAIYLLAATVLLILFAAYLAARTLVRPINKLTDVAERISMGELNIDIGIQSKDEIGQLARAVERMQTSLSLAINRLRTRR
ncbi:MAG: zinc-ribbon domain-containing protein [Desulfobacterales bacterium]|nr:zinc-ribbon domain-containing protein [Desulfobacterales bacterium]